MSKIKNKKVPNGYQMVSFDVKSLFANVPSDRHIQLVLKIIYEKYSYFAQKMFISLLMKKFINKQMA